MRWLIALLLIAGCSKGGAECLTNDDCSPAEVCNLDTLHCDPDACLADMAPPAPVPCRRFSACPKHHVCDSTIGWYCVVSPDNVADLAPPPPDMRGADMTGCR